MIVVDVANTDTPEGTSMDNDVKRKLAININDVVDDLNKRMGDIESAPKNPDKKDDKSGGGGLPPKVKEKFLITEHNSNVIVSDTTILNFIDTLNTGGVVFTVNRIGTHEADILARVILPDGNVNTMWGKLSGGYAIEIPNSGSSTSLSAYAGAQFSSYPWTVQRNRMLLHFVGDSGVYEPAQEYDSVTGDNTRLGFLRDYPSNEFAVWTAQAQNVNVNGRLYDITAIKGRVRPNLRFYDPDESQHTTDSVTRVFFKESATVYPGVTIDAPASDPPNFPYGGTDPRAFTAAITIDVKDDAFTADNLGSAGSGKAEVYKEQIGRVFWFRRLQQGTGIAITEDANYVTIACTVVDTNNTYTLDNEGTGHSIYDSSADLVVGSNTTYYLRRLYGLGGTTVATDGTRITISSTDTNTTYSHSAETATGGAFLRLTGSDATTDDVKFASGTGITVTRTDADTITIACTVTDTNTTYTHSIYESAGSVYLRLHGSDSTNVDILFQSSDASITIARIDDSTIDFVGTGTGGSGLTYDHLAVTHASGAKLRLHGSGGSTDDVLFREGTGITIDYIDNDTIEIACTVTDTNTTYDHLAVTATGGAKLRLHGSDSSTDDVLFRGAGATTVSYIDADTIEISSTDEDTLYDHLAVTATGGAKLRLHASSGTTDDVLFRGAGATTVSYIDADTIEISSTDNDTITVIDNCAAGTGAGLIFHDTTTVGSTTTYHLRKILAGTGISVSTGTHDITISCTVTDTNTLYDHLAVTAVGGAYLRLHGSDSSTDDVLFYGAGGTTVTYIDADNIEISSVDTNNTYAIDNCAAGTGAGLVYHDSTVAGSLETFHLRHIKAGTGITVTNGTHDITIDCTVVDTNTLYDHLVVTAVSGAYLRLHGSDSSTDDVLFTSAGNTVLITRTDDDTMNFEVNLDAMPYNVVGANINDCGIASAPYGWYINYTDDALTHTRTLNFRGFQVSNDLKLNVCSSDYLLDVNVTGENLTSNFELYYDKDVPNSRLQFRGLRAGAGITLSYVDDDPVVGDHDIEITCDVVDTNTTYDHLAITATGGAKLRLHGSDSSTDDVLFRGAGATTVTYIDADTIEISSTDNNSIAVVDNCTGASGTGEVWHDTTVAGSTTTYHLRKLLAGTGMDIATYTHDINIACVIAYDHLVVTATGGAKLRLHEAAGATDDVLFTSAGNTVIITRTDDDTMNFEVDMDAMPYNVVGHNVDDCNLASAPYYWYLDYDDDAGTHTRTLNFRNFNVANDLILTTCVSDYILDVNIQMVVHTTLGESIYMSKTGSTFNMRGLRAGTGITITQLDDDPDPGDSDLVFACIVAYDHKAVTDAGGAIIRLHSAAGVNDDILLQSGTGISVTYVDDDTINIACTLTDTTYTYHLLDGSPAPGTGVSDKVILRLHESTGTDYDITFREGVGVSFTRTGDQLSIIGNLSSISALDGTPAPGTGTTDQVILRLTNTNDGSTSDVTFNEGSGIVLTRSGNNITIAATAGATSDVANCATAGGAQIFHDTTVAGSNTTYNLRTINSNDGYITITQNTHEVIVSATNPLHWYAYGDQGGGSHSLRGTITGTGTYASPYVFNFKTVNAGNGILITDSSNLLTIKTDFKVTAMGLDQTEVSTLEFVDNQFGIVAIHDTATANKSKITLVDYNYNTRWDTAYFCSAGAKTTDKTIASGSWEKLYFDNETITDGAGWVFADETETVDPPFYFMHDETEDCVFEIKVKLFILGRYPTSNTIAAAMYYPQIGAFVGNTYYDTFDVNTDLHLAAQLRQTLLSTGVISSSDVTEAGTKAFLEGSMIVKLTSGSDKLNVRFKHETGNDRYFKIKKGSVSITKVGVKGAFGSPNETAINFNQT